MSGKNIRIFVVLAVISIIGIVVMQVYWFKKAFDKTENEFNKNLNIALNETVKGVLNYNNTFEIPVDPVKQLDENYFAVMVNDQINADVLEHYLRSEFIKFNIRQSFEYRIFDCANEQMVYGGFVEGEDNQEELKSRKLPVWNGDNYYFTVYFPHKAAGIVGGMTLWFFSSAVLLVVLIFFAYSLFVILQQKRFSEVQRDFINNMTHEIKTPVSIISVSAETIKDPSMIETPHRLINYATIILHEANRLKTQVERVLSLTGSESTIRLNNERFDIHQLIIEFTNNFLENTKHKEINLTFNLNAGYSFIHADRFYISNLISNLLDNAVKYSNDSIELTISSENKGKMIEIVFSDNGIGIDKEHVKKIFDKFYRVPTGNVHNVKGFGIGLNYVQLITRLHKGSIKVLSEPGKGSSFILTLPLAKKDGE
jgi:two-component system, OmpR family, phosphate regulon sensor histidine kinase PhoR